MTYSEFYKLYGQSISEIEIPDNKPEYIDVPEFEPEYMDEVELEPEYMGEPELEPEYMDENEIQPEPIIIYSDDEDDSEYESDSDFDSDSEYEYELDECIVTDKSIQHWDGSAKTLMPVSYTHLRAHET